MIAQHGIGQITFPTIYLRPVIKWRGRERERQRGGGGGGRGKREKSYTSSRLRWTKRIERRSYGDPLRVTVDSPSFYCGGRDYPYDLQQSRGDNTGKMTMNRRRRQKKGNRKGRKKSWNEFDGEEAEGELTRGIGRLWKGCGKRGYKPLSRTITIHAINLSLGPVTRIMRAVRVSASITFEIPYGLGLTPSPPHVSSSSLSRTLYFFSSTIESQLTIITRFHDFFSP